MPFVQVRRHMLAPEPAPPTIPGPVRPLSHFQPQTPSARRPTVPRHVRHTDAATAAGGTTTAARWEPRGTRGTHATSRLAHGAPGHPSPGPSYPRGADLTIAPRLSARHRSSISAGPLHDSSATPRPAGPARGQRRRSIIGARSQDHPLTPTTANAGLRPRYRFVRPLRAFTAAANDPMCFEHSHAPSDVPIVPERHASLRSTHSYPETATILVPGSIWWPSEASA